MAFFQFSGVRGFSSTFPIVARQTHARDFDFDRADPRDSTIDALARRAPPRSATAIATRRPVRIVLRLRAWRLKNRSLC